jgi:CDP-diacylglycerol---glycerol-3-phosphate 3-phosphatidyltransferase
VSASAAVSRSKPAPGRLAGVKEQLKRLAHAALDPVVALLARTGARPDQVTVLGTLLSVAAGLAFFQGRFRLASALLILSGLCDILDGQLARRLGGSSRFGAFFDSTLDRLAEAAVLAGIMGFYLRNLVALVFQSSEALAQMAVGLDPVTWAVMAFTALLALVASFMVSYTRARAEGLGLECKVGWFERPERLTLLIIAGLIKVFWAMSAALLLLAVLSIWTATQRVRHVWKLTRGAGRDQ